MISDEDSPIRAMTSIDPTAAVFLRGARLARVSTVNADGSPHVVPMWFAPADDAFYFTSRRRRRTVQNLLRENRVAFVVDDEDPRRYRAVVVEGHAHLLEFDVADIVRTIASRYLSPPGGERYAAYMLAQPDRIAFRVLPYRVSHWGIDTPDSVARVLRGEDPGFP